jgi:hypothetical protein
MAAKRPPFSAAGTKTATAERPTGSGAESTTHFQLGIGKNIHHTVRRARVTDIDETLGVAGDSGGNSCVSVPFLNRAVTGLTGLLRDAHVLRRAKRHASPLTFAPCGRCCPGPLPHSCGWQKPVLHPLQHA